MKLKSKAVGALALALAIATVGGSTAGAVGSPTAGVAQTTQQYTGSAGVALKGDFNGDGRDDVFWYVAGSGADAIWLGKAYDGTSSSTKADRFTVIPKSISGSYTPLVGDFNGDSRDDIFWYGAGTKVDAIWFGANAGTFTSANISINGVYKPLVANFNTAGASSTADDIFWYDGGGSHLWSGSAVGFSTQSYAAKPPANAKPYVGNWRQASMANGAAVHQDILFYVPGTAADAIWAGSGTGAFTSSSVVINGSYDPIIGNFDATTTTPVTTDIFWYAPGTAADSIWMNTGSSFANVKQIVNGDEKPVVVNGKTYKPVVIPAKTVGQADDILWNNPAGTGETIWNMTGANQTFAYNVVNLSTFGGSDPLARTALVGDFDIQDAPTSTAVLNSKVAVGDDHTCALTSAGGVQCWGLNTSGQLGNGSTTSSLTPVDVTGLSSGVTAITAGGNHTCAVTTTGGLKCWGANGSGQLGNSSSVNAPSPVDVTGLTSGVVTADAGTSSTCAILSTGSTRCWGLGTSGQLGNSASASSNFPVTVNGVTGASSISVGATHACAVVSGAVSCWGSNSNGQIGNNTLVNAPTPVTAVPSGATAVAAGTNFTCSLTGPGGVRCWGSDANGTQGNGAGSSANVLTATDVTGVTGHTTLLAGANNICARSVAGSGQCWGLNTSGQFGNSTSASSVSPVSVTLPAGYVAQGAGANTACGLSYTGTIRCWGANGSGQVGDGSTTNALSPTALPGYVFNVDTQANPANTDIYFVSVGDAAAQKEIIWTQLETIG